MCDLNHIDVIKCDFQMGNTVSAAEAVASGITSQHGKHGLVPDHSKFNLNSDEIPPECPMHQKLAKPAAGEYPVQHGDINPLNMVGKI